MVKLLFVLDGHKAIENFQLSFNFLSLSTHFSINLISWFQQFADLGQLLLSDFGVCNVFAIS
jgi:hypothetical protein